MPNEAGRGKWGRGMEEDVERDGWNKKNLKKKQKCSAKAEESLKQNFLQIENRKQDFLEPTKVTLPVE